MAAKHEWRKEDKALYLPGQKPELLTVPGQKFFMVSGSGDPNTNPVFANHIELLYSLSYAVRMMPKQGFTPEGYEPYTVHPLEGVWTLVNPGLGLTRKDNFSYTLMIRQPEFVTEETFSLAKTLVQKKKPDANVQAATFGKQEDGLSIQMMHIGSYDNEPESFAQMQTFLEENHLERTSHLHREIYLSDARKTDPAKQKTVLRWPVRKKEE